MRAILAVLDSLGLGASADARAYGDEDADTFGHIVLAAEAGQADIPGGRSGPLFIPNLTELGLVKAAVASRKAPLSLTEPAEIKGLWGYGVEQSLGKDTPSGHWEMAGLPVLQEWGLFEEKENSFPEDLLERLAREAGVPGFLGNCHASGTDILEALGGEHIKTGRPIIYTSADSVMQIAAHDIHFGRQRLYDVCKVARRLVDDFNLGRVIARPFVGEKKGAFERTAHRVDFASPPHGPTLLDVASKEGVEVISIGKVSDIFAGRSVSRKVVAHGNEALFDALLTELGGAVDPSLFFVNFVDFDMLYGHRRDVAGYANALEAFDERLPELLSRLEDGDVLILTADHGCDPSLPGSDHTREHVPILCYGPGLGHGPLGERSSFADIGQSLAHHLGLPSLANGVSFLK